MYLCTFSGAYPGLISREGKFRSFCIFAVNNQASAYHRQNLCRWSLVNRNKTVKVTPVTLPRHIPGHFPLGNCLFLPVSGHAYSTEQLVVWLNGISSSSRVFDRKSRCPCDCSRLILLEYAPSSLRHAGADCLRLGTGPPARNTGVTLTVLTGSSTVYGPRRRMPFLGGRWTTPCA